MTKLFNRKTETKVRQTLRQTMPTAEVFLWLQLKGKQRNGHKFRRQYSIGEYVVDFYCPEKKLAIELDGESHYQDEETRIHDKRRQSYIESFGIRFLRFTNPEIYHNIEGVVEEIEQHLKTTPTPPS